MDLFAAPQHQWVEKLRDWIRALKPEADSIRRGVVTVWHPMATPELLRAATDTPVIVLNAETVEVALEQWNRMRGERNGHHELAAAVH